MTFQWQQFKTVLLTAVIAVGATAGSGADIGQRPKKLAGLLQNEDCTDFFYNATISPGGAGEAIDRYIDVIAKAGVTVLMCNTNARRTNYRSATWQAFWDGYDPDGPDDQPFLVAVPPERRSGYRKLVGNMLKVHRQGVDYPARVIARCRRNGISPWISIRMNDVHENDRLDHPFHSPLWRKATLFRRGDPGYFARALDYAHQEVRDHYQTLIVETLHRYDIDGLELDFMREPYLFSKGEEAAGSKILTRWLREIRKLVDESARRRGHSIMVGVRVPSDPQTALGLGLDAPTWANEGLVDLVVPTPRWATMHFDIPLADWRRRLGNRVTLAGGLEVACRPYPGGPVRARDPECAAGAALSILSRGGDVVYLFNYFQSGVWSEPGYCSLLTAFTALDKLSMLPRRHVVTYHEVNVPGMPYRPPLPARGERLAFRLPLGPTPPDTWATEAIIEVAMSDQSIPLPNVFVNDIAARFAQRKPTNNGRQMLTYSIPHSALVGENRDIITIAGDVATPVHVFQVEVRLQPGQ